MLSRQQAGNGRYGHLLPPGTEEMLEPPPRTCTPWGPSGLLLPRRLVRVTRALQRQALGGGVGRGATPQGCPIRVAWGLENRHGWFDPQTNRKEACGSHK